MVQTYYENSSDHSRFVDDETASDFRKFARPFPSVPSPLLFRFHFSLFFSLSLVPLPFFPSLFPSRFPSLFPSFSLFHPTFVSFAIFRFRPKKGKDFAHAQSYEFELVSRFFGEKVFHGSTNPRNELLRKSRGIASRAKPIASKPVISFYYIYYIHIHINI